MNVPQINFSTDIVIMLTFVLIVLCGLLLGHHKVRIFAMSVYVGIVMASELGTGLYNFLASKGLTMGGGLTVGEVRITLLILPILILELGRKEHFKRGSRGNILMTLVLSVLVAALVVSSTLHLLQPDTREVVLQQSGIAWPLYTWRLWWILAVPIAVLLESFVRGRDH